MDEVCEEGQSIIEKNQDIMAERKTIYLCLAHMSEEGWEQKYVKEAFDTNWVVPMGPNVNAFEEDLRRFSRSDVYHSCRDIRFTN